MNRHRIIGVICLLVFFLPLLFAQGPQREPFKEARDLLKGYRDKLRTQKPANETLDSLKTLEAVANEMHNAVAFDAQMMLSHRDPAIRRQAAKTLAAIGVNDPQTAIERAKLFAESLQDRDPEAVAAYLKALAQLGPHAKAYIPNFLDALKNPDPRVRRAGTAVFHFLKDSDDKLIPAAISALDDPDLGPDEKTGLSSVGMSAMIYLYTHKLAAKGAAPGLTRIVKGKKGSDGFQFRALATLAAVAPEERLPLEMAREWLKKKDNEDYLIKAMGVLAELGPRAMEAVPDLIAVAKMKPFKDPLGEQRVKLAVVETFGRIGPSAKEALPTLRELTFSSDPTVRQRVPHAIKLVEGKD